MNVKLCDFTSWNASRYCFLIFLETRCQRILWNQSFSKHVHGEICPVPFHKRISPCNGESCFVQSRKMGTTVSGNHMALKYVLIYSDTHSEFVVKCRLHHEGHNIDYRSIPQFPPRVLCAQTRKSRNLLIWFLWFICKVSRFFRTFTKQSIVDSNNITLTAVREKRKTKPRGNKHKCVCTLVRMHVRMTSKWCTKRNAGSGTWCK